MKFLTTLGLFLTFSSPSFAAVTIHAFGPENVMELTTEKCSLAENAFTVFDEKNEFFTLYDLNESGKCERLIEIETECTPVLFYCSNNLYKHQSNAVFVFEETCPNATFAGKAFHPRAGANTACIEKTIQRGRR